MHLPLSHLSPYHPALHMSSISQTPSELLHNSDIHLKKCMNKFKKEKKVKENTTRQSEN
jgi:predicted MPP superfamily phosphohydrolase